MKITYTSWWAAAGLLLAALCLASCQRATPGSRLQQIRQRGTLVCGIKPGIAGFAELDQRGQYRGLDIDICRAVATAILGAPDHVRYQTIATLDELRASPDIDLVSRRLTWSLRREGLGVLFGPVMFYDGQSFLVSANAPFSDVAQLNDVPICVAEGSEHDGTVTAFFRQQQLTLRTVRVPDGMQGGRALARNDCLAFSADVSELASVRSRIAELKDARILPDRISSEPLAQLVRAEDIDLFNVLRWTVFALIAAEDLGVTSANVDEMMNSTNLDVRRLLGVAPGNGAAITLDEGWAARVVRDVGNYGEMYARNLGPESSIGLERGLNRLWSQGGQMFAPPLR